MYIHLDFYILKAGEETVSVNMYTWVVEVIDTSLGTMTVDPSSLV